MNDNSSLDFSIEGIQNEVNSIIDDLEENIKDEISSIVNKISNSDNDDIDEIDSDDESEDENTILENLPTLRGEIEEEIYDDIYNQLKEKSKDLFKNNEFSQKTIIQLTKYGMEIIEVSPIKGVLQKDILLEIMKRLILENNIEKKEKRTILKIINNGLISESIDLVIQATRGELSINQIKAKSKKIKKLVTKCCIPLIKIIKRKIKLLRKRRV